MNLNAILMVTIATGAYAVSELSGSMVLPIQSSAIAQNLHIFPSDTEISEIRLIMQGWTADLGVQCTYCHQGSNYASDENPRKNVARQMARMVDLINEDFLDGKADCVLCHRGSAIP